MILPGEDGISREEERREGAQIEVLPEISAETLNKKGEDVVKGIRKAEVRHHRECLPSSRHTAKSKGYGILCHQTQSIFTQCRGTWRLSELLACVVCRRRLIALSIRHSTTIFSQSCLLPIALSHTL